MSLSSQAFHLFNVTRRFFFIAFTYSRHATLSWAWYEVLPEIRRTTHFV